MPAFLPPASWRVSSGVLYDQGVVPMNKNQAKLRSSSTTTRGTPRQRTPKDLSRDLRLQALNDLPPNRLEQVLVRRLRRMSDTQRRDVIARRQLLPDDARREYILDLLSQ